MKKLLSILGSIIITGTTAATVVACAKDTEEDKHENALGNSVWAFLPGIGEGLEIDSADVWNQIATPFVDIGSGEFSNNPEDWSGPIRRKMAIQILQIFNVAILANSDKMLEEVDEAKLASLLNVADYRDLKSLLSNEWNNLKRITDTKIDSKKEEFKDAHGKKWEDEYKEWLENNYGDVTGASGDAKYKIEENNFRAAIMVSGDEGGTSATSLLTNVLLRDNMRSYDSSSNSLITGYLREFFAHIKSGNEASEWRKGNQDSRIKLASGFAFSYEEANKWGNGFDNLSSLDIDKSIENLATKLEGYETAEAFLTSNKFYAAPEIDAKTKKVKYSSIDKQQYQLSMFQKYSLETWFKNEKPLAISKISYNFKDSSTAFDGGITLDDFEESMQTKFNKDIKKFNSTNNWETIYYEADGTKTTESELLTLNSTSGGGEGEESGGYTNILKANVYDSLSKTGEAMPGDQSIEKIIPEINRSTGSNFYKKYQFGSDIPGGGKDSVIVYVDTDGLHVLHIDGSETGLLSKIDGTSQNKIKDYNNQWQFDTTGFHQNFYKDSKNKENQVKADSQLNSQFKNTGYLQYLVNRSKANTQSTSRTKWEVMDAVNNYAVLNNSSSGTNNEMWFWTYKFFDNFYGNMLQKDDWIKQFLGFKNQDGELTEPTWFIQTLSAAESYITNNGVTNFQQNMSSENDTIAAYEEAWNMPLLIDIDAVLEQITDTSDVKNSVWFWNVITDYNL